MSVTVRNSNAAMMTAFLYHLVNVLKEYFQEVDEESIRDNFVIVYELLDEMMDFGFPQVTDVKILQEYITTESHKVEAVLRPPPAVTGAVSWRTEGIKWAPPWMGGQVLTRAQVSEERGVFGRRRERESLGEC